MVFCRRHTDVFFESLREQTHDSRPLRAWMKETVRRADQSDRFVDSRNRSEHRDARRNELVELASRVPPKDSVVYFVEREGLVKIGITKKLDKRLKEISGGSAMIEGMTIGPVRLLGSIPGDSTRNARSTSSSATSALAGNGSVSTRS